MKISLNWLKKYISLDMDPEKIGEILTDIGLEVEGMDQIESIKGGLEGLVVGEILTCEKHPNADKLKCTTVNVGGEEPLSIVCGAPNCAAGQKVIVATHGTTIHPIEGEPFKIKKGKIRGEVSAGMICAEDEIGLGTDHDGIIVLDNKAEVGTPASEVFEVTTDTVYEIGLTPNRCDATCHLGVADDLLAYLKINHELDGQVIRPDLGDLPPHENTLPFTIEVEDNVGCPRYTGMSFKNVKVGPSPQWLKDNLHSIGVRSINNVVDITNFILHTYGQPLHAFDADKVAGHKIVVCHLPEGTKFTTLDEKERSLRAEDLMICDGEKNGLCLAGIFGGISSGVTEETTNVFLEAAHFNGGMIRRSSTAHLLRTDAAKVFEKGSDPNITKEAMLYTAKLFQELCGAAIASEIYDVYPKKIERTKIELHYEKINRVIGIDIDKEEVHSILLALNMELKPVDQDSVQVSVPTNKCEVLREVDLIEEILRIYGFNKVPIPATIKSTINYEAYPNKKSIIQSIATTLSSNGFNEMMGLSLIEDKHVLPQLNLASEDLVYINNTSNIHLNIMRPEPMISGLISVLHNHNYQQKDLKLYELGRSYKTAEGGFTEKEFLTIFLSGAEKQEHWTNTGGSGQNLYSIKQWADWVLQRVGIHSFQADELEEARWDYGLSYRRGKDVLVKFGAVSSDILEHLDIKSDVFYAEFDLETLIRSIGGNKVKVAEISKYPGVRRDLALVLDESVAYANVQKAAHSLKSKILQNVNLFDIYKSEEHLGKNKKSYAIKLLFQDKDKTLKDKVVDKEIQQLIKIFEDKLGASIRS